MSNRWVDGVLFIMFTVYILHERKSTGKKKKLLVKKNSINMERPFIS